MRGMEHRVSHKFPARRDGLRSAARILGVAAICAAVAAGGACDRDGAMPLPDPPAPIVMMEMRMETGTVGTVVVAPPAAETETATVAMAMGEPEPVEPPAPPPVPPTSLVADDYSVVVGSASGKLLSPLLSVYDTGEPGSTGVDVDRSTLVVSAIGRQPALGVAEIVDGTQIAYKPADDLDFGLADTLTDTIVYTARTDSEGIEKEASATITITLEWEDLHANWVELGLLLDANFTPDTDASIRRNFRYRDGVSREDLEILRYFADNGFSGESIRTIMEFGSDLSPLATRRFDRHTLRKLLAVEQGIHQNATFLNSVHGRQVWEPLGGELIMRRASFLLPSHVEIVEGLKTINYDKLDLDETFEDVGGEYKGVFSRGQNYSPFYKDDTSIENISDSRTPEGLEYLKKIHNSYFEAHETIINFSMLSVLDEFGYTIDKKLVDKDSTEIAFLFDKQYERTLSGLSSTFGGYGFVVPWENGFLTYGETEHKEKTNLYNQVRKIIGVKEQNSLEGVFRISDYLIEKFHHERGRPYWENYRFNLEEEVNALLNLPNNAYYPSVYDFIPEKNGGIVAGNSQRIPGTLTASLRVLGISSEQFNSNAVDVGSRNRNEFSIKYLEQFYSPDEFTAIHGFNVGMILIDKVPWFYEGNFPLGSRVTEFSYEVLISQSDFTEEQLTEIHRSSGDKIVEYFYRRTELKEEYEALILGD